MVMNPTVRKVLQEALDARKSERRQAEKWVESNADKDQTAPMVVAEAGHAQRVFDRVDPEIADLEEALLA